MRHPLATRPTLTIATLLLIGTSSAVAQSPGYCEIAFDFSIEGKLVGAPTTLVEVGQPADLTIDKPDRTGAWQFHIVADAPTVLHRATTIPVSIEINEITAGQSYLRAAPQVRVMPGQRADLQMIFGDDDGRHAQMHLAANPRTEAEAQALLQRADDAAADEPEPQ